MRHFAWVWLCFFVAGCVSPDAGLRRVHLRIAMPDAVDCRPLDEVMQLRIDGLGDFPFTAESTSLLVPAGESARLEDFPPATRTIILDTTGLESGARAWVAAGARSLPEGSLDASILMLPFGKSCPLADPSMRAPRGAAAVALEDGSMLLVGGEGAGVSSRVLLLHAGEQFAERLVPDLGSPAVAATATASQRWVVLAGGAGSIGGPPHGGVTLYDHSHGSLIPLDSTLIEARKRHGATRLPDGRVLLVGGEGDVGALASAETVDPETGAIEAAGQLPEPRVEPRLVTLDDGSVLSLGGFASPGATESSESVSEYDPLTKSFRTLGAAEASVLPLSRFHAVALTGGRVAWIGDHRDGLARLPECTSPPECVRLIRRVPPYQGDGAFETRDIDVPGLPELSEVSGVGLADGSLLMMGRDAFGAARAYRIDLGRGSLEEVEASRAPSLLLALGDASVIELDEAGASLHRELLLTSYDRTPATFDTDSLAFDAVGSWAFVDAIHFEALRADSRFDVPTLRFRDFQLDSLEVSGGIADLLLLPEGGPPVAIRIGSDAVGPALCEVGRLPDAELTLTREGSRLTFSAGGESRVCHLPALGDRVGVAVRADIGVTVGNLKIRRL